MSEYLLIFKFAINPALATFALPVTIEYIDSAKISEIAANRLGKNLAYLTSVEVFYLGQHTNGEYIKIGEQKDF